MTYRDHCLAKNERNRAMIADYLGGLSRAEVAAKYGVHVGRVGRLFRNAGVVLPAPERARRQAAAVRYTRNQGGRPAVWPDCPPELRRDYKALRRCGIPAAEARAELERMAA